jgi:hypothetical protein
LKIASEEKIATRPLHCHCLSTETIKRVFASIVNPLSTSN